MGRNHGGRAHKSRSQCKPGYNVTVQSNAKSNKNTRMPMCTYGRACTRKGCIYQHPAMDSQYSDDDDGFTRQVCKPFLAGGCLYGRSCNNQHPSKEEADALVAKYAMIQCRFGMDCQNSLCLYAHEPPTPPPEEDETPLQLPPEGSVAPGDVGPDPRLARVRALLRQKAQQIDARAIETESICPGAEFPSEEAGVFSLPQTHTSEISSAPSNPEEEGLVSAASKLSVSAAEFVPSWG